MDAYYEDGAFYTVTSGPSNKMREIAHNPNVAICIIVENFTAHGIGENLGWVMEERNTEMMAKLRAIFAEWYDEANDDSNPGTCLLRIRLINGLWNFPHEGRKKEIDFVNKTAT